MTTTNVSAKVVKVRLQCGGCRGYIGTATSNIYVTCNHCNKVNQVVLK